MCLAQSGSSLYIYLECPQPPPISNGSFNIHAVKSEFGAIYSCDPGYQLHGQSPLICKNTTGQWSAGFPTCGLGTFMIQKHQSINLNF